jgi:class 3 adenylate cyclase
MTDQQITRRLVAILAADMVDYSRFMNEDENATIAAWHAARNEVIDPTVAKHTGRIVKHTGDGFLAEFSTVSGAVQCALDMQAEFEARRQDPSRRPVVQFRMGINLGDIVVDADDIHGDGVNIAARLEGLADPGGVCVSGDVYRQIRNKLDLGYRSLGEKQVKNIAEPVVAWMIAPPGMPGYQPARFHDATDSNIFVPRKGKKKPEEAPQADNTEVSPRKRLALILITLILGIFGGHRYYLGKRKTAILMTITVGGAGLWFLYDLIIVLVDGDIRDNEGRKVSKWV